MSRQLFPAFFAVVAGFALFAFPGGRALGQDDPRLVRADSLHDALMPEEELTELKAVLAESPGNAAALWRAARAQVDIAKQIKGDHDYVRGVRDSIYEVGRDYAERAVAADSNEAEAHFTVALALGQLSLTRGGNARVKFARIIYDEAARTLALDSAHDGAHHVLGAWHAEIKRLSGLTRFFAKNLFGAGFMDRAHWDSATTHLEQAVALNPTYVHHRLELAQVYADRKRWTEAREQLEAIPELPDRDVLDADHRQAAAALLKKIEGK
jgi:tetratricopeptide (TPR) repeat protein